MMTREQWLRRMTTLMRPMYRSAGSPLPKAIRVSCGWPSGRALAASGKSRSIGQCWNPLCSADGTTEVFISPCIAEATAAAGVLAHELCHAAIGTEDGHGGAFKRLALRIGLTGKMTETEPGPELTQRLNALIAGIGPYPHATLDLTKSGIKKQSTRLLKVTCPECGYTVRTTQKWIETGLPTCPCGTEMEADQPDEEEPEE